MIWGRGGVKYLSITCQIPVNLFCLLTSPNFCINFVASKLKYSKSGL